MLSTSNLFTHANPLSRHLTLGEQIFFSLTLKIKTYLPDSIGRVYYHGIYAGHSAWPSVCGYRLSEYDDGFGHRWGRKGELCLL